MARHSQPQNQSNQDLLIFDGKNSTDLSYGLFRVVYLLASLFIVGFNGSLHAAWFAGASAGCFDNFQQAMGVACANNNPDTTSNPGVSYYRDSCVITTPPNFIVYAHMVSGSSSASFSYSAFLGTCVNTIDVGKNLGSVDSANSGYCPTGNPINQGTGNKFQLENDYKGKILEFSRYYNSTPIQRPGIVANWLHTYSSALSVSLSTTVAAYRPDGKAFNFSLNATTNQWVSDSDSNHTLIQLKDSSNNLLGWTLAVDHNTQTETYDVNGKLLSITTQNGLAQTLNYSDSTTPANIAPRTGLLIKVTDSLGRSLNFTYDPSARMNSMIDPSGAVTAYNYDANNNLITATYPDNTKRTYIYGELSNTANVSQPHALTGIVDENSNRFATWKYDSAGRAISSEHAGGVEKYGLAYGADGRSVSITDPLGAARNTQFVSVLGVIKSTGSNQPGGSGCGASASALSYDANGNIASRTDFNGNLTNYAYDLTRNLETSRTEGLTTTGATTPATRTITTVWHSTFRLPVQITNANQQTTYTYNSQGDITQKTITDTTANTTRSWNTAYTYSTVPGVLLQKVEDGPRTDVSDLTTYDYYPADAICTGGLLGCRGQLMQITDALGHITRLTRYSPLGQLEELTDPNGLVTKMTYDVRQRLTSFNAGGEITSYTYDPVGQLTRVTRPDGAYLTYSYDAAHRLIKTQDNLGNTLTYTLDALGNRIKEEAHDPGGQLARSQSRVYDALSRLQSLTLPQ